MSQSPAAFLPFTRPSIDEATIAGVVDVLRSGWLTSGPQMRAFEARLSDYFGGRAVCSLVSGTGALELALTVIGAGPGDEIITTPLSWVATANVIVRAGAKPVFVDIDPVTRNIDPARIEAAMTPRTKAILAVDMAGLPFDRSQVYAIAKKHGVRVIEDAAQSLGAQWNGQRIGSMGDITCFSFHANKNLTTAEGGCIVLSDPEEAARCVRLRLQGVTRLEGGEQEVEEAGAKLNLTDVAARIGLGQLDQLEAFNAQRHILAKRYFQRLDRTLGCTLPLEDFSNTNWHMFQILLPLANLRASRAEVMQALHNLGIGTGVHYPAMHLFKLYRAQGWREGDFPHAEAVGRSTLTLPLFPAMQPQDVDRVCHALSTVLRPLMIAPAA
jgi:dTDP-4-amino-4,6-dideoxygalactose transaminase